jgi:hypothetical protein
MVWAGGEVQGSGGSSRGAQRVPEVCGVARSPLVDALFGKRAQGSCGIHFRLSCGTNAIHLPYGICPFCCTTVSHKTVRRLLGLE